MRDKKILLVFLFLIFSFYLTGCTSENRRYSGRFGGYVNEQFAQKLENCSKYSAPAYYHFQGVIQLRRHKVKIEGKRNNMCTIKEEDIGILFPGGNFKNEFSIPMRYVANLSTILQTAFKEPEHHEEIAVGLALKFCRKLNITSCTDQYEFFNEKALEPYLNAIEEYFEHKY